MSTRRPSGRRALASFRRKVLILPPGGFALKAEPWLMGPACRAADRAGFRPIEVSYPTFNVAGALQHTLDVANSTGARLAYGESAGGALAGRLATLGNLDRVVLNAPISNLLTWDLYEAPEYGLPLGWGVSPAGLRWLSPTFHATKVPIDILHSHGDQTVPYEDSVAWAERDPLVTIHDVEDPHISGPTYEAKLELAFRLLREGVKRDRRIKPRS